MKAVMLFSSPFLEGRPIGGRRMFQSEYVPKLNWLKRQAQKKVPRKRASHSSTLGWRNRYAAQAAMDRGAGRARGVSLALTLAGRNKVTPVRGFSPFSPYSLHHSAKRLAEALSAPIPLIYKGELPSRRERHGGCERARRNLEQGFSVNARNNKTVN
jgi:hypothetical protein